uniref:Uncharacterized protein n=1 Tax=Magnetococcus massalia (strain MO-1) TaxID=451514 RepID=A0A1S7LEI1_MAGMO|nr:protein of unknown function [Candidatus Magnetococcus massalia]
MNDGINQHKQSAPASQSHSGASSASFDQQEMQALIQAIESKPAHTAPAEEAEKLVLPVNTQRWFVHEPQGAHEQQHGFFLQWDHQMSHSPQIEPLEPDTQADLQPPRLTTDTPPPPAGSFPVVEPQPFDSSHLSPFPWSLDPSTCATERYQGSLAQAIDPWLPPGEQSHPLFEFAASPHYWGAQISATDFPDGLTPLEIGAQPAEQGSSWSSGQGPAFHLTHP